MIGRPTTMYERSKANGGYMAGPQHAMLGDSGREGILAADGDKPPAPNYRPADDPGKSCGTCMFAKDASSDDMEGLGLPKPPPPMAKPPMPPMGMPPGGPMGGPGAGPMMGGPGPGGPPPPGGPGGMPPLPPALMAKLMAAKGGGGPGGPPPMGMPPGGPPPGAMGMGGPPPPGGPPMGDQDGDEPTTGEPRWCQRYSFQADTNMTCDGFKPAGPPAGGMPGGPGPGPGGPPPMG